MLSAVVLTHNNEEILETCLASLTWADEIIVIDDFSTDKTAQIAAKFKAKIFPHHLNDDFSKQRNFGLSKARGDWIFFVDSDEIISAQLALEIQEMINSMLNDKCEMINGIRGYFIKRVDVMWGRELRYGETANVKLLRLAKRNAGIWQGKVHEIWRAEGPTGLLRHPLQHFPHPNVAQFLSKINYYSSLRAKELLDQGICSNLWQILAYPKAKFFLNYFWRRGFLDGTTGMITALLMSFHSFLVRSKLWLLRHKNI